MYKLNDIASKVYKAGNIIASYIYTNLPCWYLLEKSVLSKLVC